jgi:ankyrin repeat protein
MRFNLVFLLELTPAALQDTMTPLHNAAHMGQPEAVKALLEAKAMANIRLVRSELELLIHACFDHPRFLAH